MSTLGREQKRRRGLSAASILVIAAVLGAVAFGAYLGYLAWANDSFPSQVKPFSEYANVTSVFNGTEYAFQVRWLNSSYLPMYAQLTSPDSDQANTPVCSTGLNSVKADQTVFMPFSIEQASATLTDVNLWIAVKNLTNGAEFSIIYNVPNVSANPGDIAPISESCYEPQIVE